MTDTNNEILSEIKGSLGIITLNRPAALNALSIGMVKEITECLEKWEHDERVKAVYFNGAGERAFCAGGDIKQVYRDALLWREGECELSDVVAILYQEYRLNRYMNRYPKPMAVYMHGITMGGGYGLAANCDIRIVEPKSRFAMPEVGIGFFTDVGSVHHLQSCPHYAGKYLVMSGGIIDAGDMIYTGIATHFSDSPPDESFIFNALNGNSLSKKLISTLEEKAAVLEAHFRFNDPQSIFSSLEKDTDEWAEEALSLLRTRSPLSVSICCEYYARAGSMTFDDIMAVDFTLAQHFMGSDDFYEGIRAVLIDRDKAPQWAHENITSVRPEAVQGFFETAQYDLNDDNFNRKYT